jgi:hypothetical protein
LDSFAVLGNAILQGTQLFIKIGGFGSTLFFIPEIAVDKRPSVIPLIAVAPAGLGLENEMLWHW